LIWRTKQVLQGSTNWILGYKPPTKFYISSTKFLHPYQHLRGTPLLCYSERDTIPRKNIQATNYYKNVEFFLEGVWLWRISGSYSFRDFYRSIWNFLSQLRQWDSRL